MSQTNSSSAIRPSRFEVEKPILPPQYDTAKLDTDQKISPNQDIPIYNDLEFVSEKDLSLASIIKGNAANPLTNFERKAALINA